MSNVLEPIPKGAESPPRQLQFATSTGLGQDPPKLQMGKCANRSAKLDLLQTDQSRVQVSRVDVLYYTHFTSNIVLYSPARNTVASTRHFGPPYQPPYKFYIQTWYGSELARSRDALHYIHDVHAKFRKYLTLMKIYISSHTYKQSCSIFY